MTMAFSQGLTCGEIQPFCAGDTTLIFENSSGAGNAESGPDYGCLVTQPNPTWYYIQIDQDGDLFFTIEQNTSVDFTGAGIDVDFIAWGPFPIASACNELTAANQVPGSWQAGDSPFNTTTSQGCSYSPNSIESFNVIDANAGEFYVLVITNFENVPGFILMQQTNIGGGSGATDCSIVTTINYCEGEVVTLDATTNNAVLYEWYRDAVLLPETGPILNNVMAPSAIYTANVYDIANNLISTIEFNINFNSVPIAFQADNILQCDDNNDGIWDFDLTIREADVLGTQDVTQFTISYHASQADADVDSNAIPNPTTFTNTSSSQTIYVRIDNNDNNDCFDTTSFSIEVFDTPTANSAIDIEQCDNMDDSNDTNGVVTFDLSTKINEVLGTQLLTEFEVKFYYTQPEADAGVVGTDIMTPIQNTSNPQSIVARIENRLNTNCYDTITFNLIVFELPVVLPLIELFQCDDDTDGFTEFNLTESNELISTNYLNETFTYHISLPDAENGFNAIPNETTYLNIDPSAAPDILYVRIENANGCYRTSQLNLLVSTTEIPANFQLNYEVCDDTLVDGDDRNGIASFDFSDATAQITNLFPIGQTLTITYYETLSDALQETNAIVDISNHRNETSSFSQTIFVRVDSDIDNACLGLGEHITLTVNPLPIIDLEDEYLLCLNTNGTEEVDLPIIDTGLSDTAYSFVWSLNNTIITGFTGSSYAPTQGGTYSVLVTYTITGCQDIDSTIVYESEPPTVTAELISLAFADNHVIEATAIGSGVYEYSLDGGPWQESGIFENVSPGEHIVTARDINGCGINTAIVIVIDYPLYFTPNGDGYHDTWNIVGIENQPTAKIFIFDRYGKLLKQITPMGNGWNGTYNGNRLPTSDYWFTIEYNEPRMVQENNSKPILLLSIN